LQSVIKESEWVRIEKLHTMPIDGRIFVIELDVGGSKTRMIGILMETNHQVPLRFDPVNTIVFTIDTSWIPKANLQSYVLRVVGFTQKRYRLDIRDDVPRSSS
jgi:threonyl-tRNA synthetase